MGPYDREHPATKTAATGSMKSETHDFTILYNVYPMFQQISMSLYVFLISLCLQTLSLAEHNQVTPGAGSETIPYQLLPSQPQNSTQLL